MSGTPALPVPDDRAARIAALAKVIRTDPGVAQAEELIEVLDALSDADPEAFTRPLAAALLGLAAAYRDAGDLDSAVHFAREGCIMFRDLAAEDDSVERQYDYAMGLEAVADFLEDAGWIEEAARAAAVALRTLDNICANLAPGEYRPSLLHAMLIHEGLLEKLGETEEAMRMLRHALGLSLNLEQEEIPRAGDDIYEAAHRYSQLCIRLKRPTDDDELYDRVLARLVANDLLEIEQLEFVSVRDP